MTKFSKVTPTQDYILHIVTDNNKEFDFDVNKQLKKIPSYKKLYHVEFFNKVKHNDTVIFWDLNHDFHIDQVMNYAENIK